MPAHDDHALGARFPDAGASAPTGAVTRRGQPPFRRAASGSGPGCRRGRGQVPFDGVAVLAEMVPALVVDGEGGSRGEETAQLYSLTGRHRIADRSRQREAHAAHVQQGGAHVQATCKVSYAVVEDGVSGDPQHAVPLSRPVQREAGDVSGDRPGQRRAVAGGRRGDVDRRASWGLKVCGRPGRQANGVAAESSCSGRRGEYGVRGRQQGAPGHVEVVAVVVVAEQDGVDGRQVRDGEGGAGRLTGGGAPAEPVAAARRIERRVGQQPPAADLDQCGRAADVGDADVGHAVILPVARGGGYDRPGRAGGYRACDRAHDSA